MVTGFSLVISNKAMEPGQGQGTWKADKAHFSTLWAFCSLLSSCWPRVGLQVPDHRYPVFLISRGPSGLRVIMLAWEQLDLVWTIAAMEIP